MNTHDAFDPPGMDPESLDGHTIEELSEYLDSGRFPPESSIDESAGCQIALEALERLRSLTPDLIAADTAAEPEADESWVRSILAGIAVDARAGRRIPVVIEPLGADAGITEGAVRGVIRAAESAVPGILVGRSRFDGDVTVAGEPVVVQVDVCVPYGAPIPDLVARLRAEISRRLTAHTTLNVTGIDITVSDVRRHQGRIEVDR
jgi:uncharacterized alkaline shock family protein YloU